MLKYFLKMSFSFGLLLALLGCNAAQPEESSPQNAPERPYVIEGELLAGPSALNWIDEAVDDLAAETGAELSEIAFTQLDLVVWPDGLYDCPSHFNEDDPIDPTPKEGYKIHLRLNGRVYFYHGGEGTEQFLCRELE